MIPPNQIPPYRRPQKGTFRLLFSGDFSEHVTTRLLAGGYRLIIAVNIFAVLFWMWIGYGLQQSEWTGSLVPVLIILGAPLLGLLSLASVRMAFEYLTVIFRINGKVHDLDAKLGYLAERAWRAETAQKAATPPGNPGPVLMTSHADNGSQTPSESLPESTPPPQTAKRANMPTSRPTQPQPSEPPSERLLTVMDVARYLGISRDSVFGLLRSGELKSVLIRKRARRITPEQLRDYINGLQDRT